jgi:predicted nucleic acid-binding protein
MTSPPLMFDTGPLAKLVHPRPDREFVGWFAAAIAADQRIVIPEIADYELRRKLLHQDLTQSVVRLDSLEAFLGYLPIDTPTLRRAAELWAAARRRGHPTAPPAALDGDVILAAQAEAAGAIVVTEDLEDLSQFVPARRWTEISF